MTVEKWSARFFERLGREIDRDLEVYVEDGHPCSRIGEYEIRVVGCDNDFVSVWYEAATPGPIFDDAATLETVEQAAIHTAKVIELAKPDPNNPPNLGWAPGKPWSVNRYN